MSDPGHGQVHDAAAQTTRVHKLTSQQEKRHGQQREVVCPVDKTLRQNLAVESVDHAVAGHVGHEAQTTHQQGVGNGHAQCHGTQQAENKNGDGHARPRNSGSISARTTLSSESTTSTRSASASCPVNNWNNLCRFMMPITKAVT